jgi:hypothetical protein
VSQLVGMIVEDDRKLCNIYLSQITLFLQLDNLDETPIRTCQS